MAAEVFLLYTVMSYVGSSTSGLLREEALVYQSRGCHFLTHKIQSILMTC
jgi:hypothetical protein